MMDPRLIKGKPTSDGVVTGVAIDAAEPPGHVEKPEAETLPGYTLKDLQLAISKTQEQLREFQHNIKERITESVTQIFSAHLIILEDVVFIGQIKKCVTGGSEIPTVICQIIDQYIALFIQSSDARIREKVDDMEDLKQRLMDNLTLQADAGASRDYHGKILITPKMFPSALLRFVAQNGEGIILTSGGVTAHISVLARSLAIPMILADNALLTGITTGPPLLMDAHAGLIYANPEATIISSYGSLLETRGQMVTDTDSINPRTCTQDRYRIRLLAAVGLVSEAKLAHELRAEGIGLYRSEMSFLIRSDLPTKKMSNTPCTAKSPTK